MADDHATDHANAKDAGLPPLLSESDIPSTHRSPAEPSSEDPITRSVRSGLLDDPTRSRTTAGTQESANSSESEGDLEASGELAALRGRGRTVGMDMDDYDSADGIVEKTDKPAKDKGEGMHERLKELHPYATMLGMNDLDSVVAIENACFEKGQAATREKIEYRLSTCGELTFGIFSSASATKEPQTLTLSAATASTSHPPDSADPNRKGILLAALVATKTTNSTIQDSDMLIAPSYSMFHGDGDPSQPMEAESSHGSQHIGHDEAGRTLALHSLAVLPDYQRLGVGTMLIRAYVQRMVEAENADRIALLTYPRLVKWYEELGFENLGESRCTYGGGGWIDMVLDFANISPDPEGDEDDEDDDDFLDDADAEDEGGERGDGKDGKHGDAKDKGSPLRRQRAKRAFSIDPPDGTDLADDDNRLNKDWNERKKRPTEANTLLQRELGWELAMFPLFEDSLDTNDEVEEADRLGEAYLDHMLLRTSDLVAHARGKKRTSKLKLAEAKRVRKSKAERYGSAATVTEKLRKAAAMVAQGDEKRFEAATTPWELRNTAELVAKRSGKKDKGKGRLVVVDDESEIEPEVEPEETGHAADLAAQERRRKQKAEGKVVEPIQIPTPAETATTTPLTTPQEREFQGVLLASFKGILKKDKGKDRSAETGPTQGPTPTATSTTTPTTPTAPGASGPTYSGNRDKGKGLSIQTKPAQLPTPTETNLPTPASARPATSATNPSTTRPGTTTTTPTKRVTFDLPIERIDEPVEPAEGSLAAMLAGPKPRPRSRSSTIPSIAERLASLTSNKRPDKCVPTITPCHDGGFKPIFPSFDKRLTFFDGSTWLPDEDGKHVINFASSSQNPVSRMKRKRTRMTKFTIEDDKVENELGWEAHLFEDKLKPQEREEEVAARKKKEREAELVVGELMGVSGNVSVMEERRFSEAERKRREEEGWDRADGDGGEEALRGFGAFGSWER